VRWHGARDHHSLVSLSAASVSLGITIEDFSPKPLLRNPYPVAVTRNGCEIACDDQEVFGQTPFAKQANNTILRVIAVDPLKASRIKIDLIKGGLFPVDSVYIGHPALNAFMMGIFGQVPIQAAFMIPFVPLAEFSTHKKEFLGWLGIHITKEKTKIGKLLPVVPRHLSQEGSLSIDHLIVRKGQNEILMKGVKHAKGQFIVVIFPVNGVL
jgi:hypothetical protein